MYRTHAVVGFVLVAVGAIWIGQGLGLLRGSGFMVDDIRWAVVGAVAATVGIVLLVRARRSRAR